jgi:hypothetical protein
MAPSNEFILRAIVGFIVEDESKMARDSRRRARRGMFRIYTPLAHAPGYTKYFQPPAPIVNLKQNFYVRYWVCFCELKIFVDTELYRYSMDGLLRMFP